MLNDLTDRLNLSTLPQEFEPQYQATLNEFNEKGVFFLESDYIKYISKKTGTLSEYLPVIIDAAEKIKADPDASLYALFVYYALKDRNLFIKYIGSFSYPEEYNLFNFVCLIPSIENTFSNYKKRNVPDDIIKETLKVYDETLALYGAKNIRNDSFCWLQRYVDCIILHIGALKHELRATNDPVYMLENKKTYERVLLFDGKEMNSAGLYYGTPPVDSVSFVTEFIETDDAYIGNPVDSSGRCLNKIVVCKKDEYELLVKPRDMFLNVHIATNADLSKEACDSSYKKAKEVFRLCFPEHDFKGFRCRSWLLSSELDGILKPTSNILRFKSEYNTYPLKTEGNDIFNFVFNRTFDNYNDIPEDTSLQRGIKQIYLSGKYIYEYGGIRL